MKTNKNSESKTKKTLRNLAWGILYRSLAALLPFIARTVIIDTLGMEYAGIGSLFGSILNVLSLAELGISESIIFSMYEPLATGNDKEICALLKLYRKAYLSIGTVILIVGLIINIKIDYFVSGDYPASMNLQILFLIYLANTVISYYSFSYLEVLLIANQRNDIEYKISSIIGVIRDTTQIVLLLGFKDYYIYILILPLMTLIHNIVRAVVVKRKYPQFKCEGVVEAKTLQVIKKQVGSLMLGKLTVVSRNAFDSIVISSFLGLTAVALYNNYYLIMNIVYSFIIYFVAAMRGGIGNNVAVYSKEKNFSDMLNLYNIFWWVFGMCTILLFCLYQPFMQLWVGKEMTYGFSVVILFSLYLYLLCNFLVFSQYMEAKGLYWENRIRFILESFCNLFLNVVFVKIWGVTGVVLATIVSVLFLTNIYGTFIGFKYFFTDCNIKKYVMNQVSNFAVTAVGCFLAYQTSSLIYLDGIAGLLLRAIVVAATGMAVFILAKFKTKSFISAKQYLMERVPSLRK